MRRWTIVLAGLLPLAVAACGGGGKSEGAAATTSRVAGASVRNVTVREREYHLAFSTRKLSPGTYRFTALNVGKIAHALEIDGPGVEDMRTPGTIAPGKSATLTVTLRRGSYEVYCPVPGHRALGMQATLKVGGAAAAAPAKPASTSTSSSSGGGAWG